MSVIIDEKKAREISKYVVKLVRRQPQWLKGLFGNSRVRFAVSKDGVLYLEVDEALEPRIKTSIDSLIGRYLNNHPPSFISLQQVH